MQESEPVNGLNLFYPTTTVPVGAIVHAEANFIASAYNGVTIKRKLKQQ